MWEHARELNLLMYIVFYHLLLRRSCDLGTCMGIKIVDAHCICHFPLRRSHDLGTSFTNQKICNILISIVVT